jgi:hypothetical protein
MKPFSIVVLICALLLGCKRPEQFDAAAVKAKIDAACEAQEQADVKGDAIGTASDVQVLVPGSAANG